MQIFRRLTHITALSFDLDDTLYSNEIVMQQAYQAMHHYFVQHSPKLAEYQWPQWRNYRQMALAHNAKLKHDVTAWRQSSYTLALMDLGVNETKAKQQAKQATSYFLQQRSNFTVDNNTQQWLAQLAKRWPLIAISNGNVNVEQIGIAPYFSLILQANGNNLCKPDSDMFIKACQYLNIKPSELLHIGDCGNSDVIGALNAGCQTVWLDQYNVGKPIKVLPHIRISQLTELNSIL